MKFISTLLFSLLIFIQIIKSQSGLSAILYSPEIIEFNKPATFKLEIIKPQGLTSYAVFKQNLPAGFFMTSKVLNGANIQFDNNQLTITWLRLPVGEKLTVAWDVFVQEGLIGKFELNGSINYMTDNTQGIFELSKTYIEVVKNKYSVVSNDNQSKNVIPKINNYRNDINCERIIVFNENKKYYLVEIKLKSQKPHIFSITEKIPSGYQFKEFENRDVAINEQKRTIQFITGKIQAAKEFSLKYMLIPEVKTNINTPDIYGKLSFIEDNQIINLSVLNKK
jgi:hypothetical protein